MIDREKFEAEIRAYVPTPEFETKLRTLDSMFACEPEDFTERLRQEAHALFVTLSMVERVKAWSMLTTGGVARLPFARNAHRAVNELVLEAFGIKK